MDEMSADFSPKTTIKRNCDLCGKTDCFINKYCSFRWKKLLTGYKETYRTKAGELIFTKGDEAKGIYCVYTGYIKVFDFDDEKERIVDLIAGGHILGYREIGTRNTTYSVSARALSDCEITYFPFDVFNLAIEANSKLLFYLLDLFTEKLHIVEKRLRNFQHLQVKEKIVFALVDMIKTFGFDKKDSERLNFTLSRKDIADLAGTTYESVIRVLSDLDKQKIIKLDGKEIRITDKLFFEGKMEELK